MILPLLITIKHQVNSVENEEVNNTAHSQIRYKEIQQINEDRILTLKLHTMKKSVNVEILTRSWWI